MTEAEARAALAAFDAVGGLEAWIAEQPWLAAPSGWVVPEPLQGCVVPGSSGASLAREGEDALWQQVFTAQPERRRVFEPSSKRRKKAPGPWPPATG
jgi:hypothetical protein